MPSALTFSLSLAVVLAAAPAYAQGSTASAMPAARDVEDPGDLRNWAPFLRWMGLSIIWATLPGGIGETVRYVQESSHARDAADALRGDGGPHACGQPRFSVRCAALRDVLDARAYDRNWAAALWATTGVVGALTIRSFVRASHRDRLRTFLGNRAQIVPGVMTGKLTGLSIQGKW